MTIVSLRRELEEARAGALTARVMDEISRMMDEQLAQNQTIDTLRRQVESSNTSAQQVQALLLANQEQQSRMPPPNNNPSGAGGVIGNTPFMPPLSTPSTGLQRDLDEAMEADDEYRTNPSLPRLCHLLAELAYKWERIESQSRRMSGYTSTQSSDTKKKTSSYDRDRDHDKVQHGMQSTWPCT